MSRCDLPQAPVLVSETSSLPGQARWAAHSSQDNGRVVQGGSYSFMNVEIVKHRIDTSGKSICTAHSDGSP